MAASIQQDALLAQFSVLAYRDREFLSNSANLPTGWRMVREESQTPPFAAFAFKNDSTGQVIIAYRGTDGLKDLTADAAIFAGRWDPQFQKALDFAQAVRGNEALFPDGFDRSKVFTTGHSLGGAQAQIVAQAFGLDGSTIDPGAAGRIVNTAEFKAAMLALQLPENGIGAAASFTNHLVAGSLVSSATGAHVGSSSYLPSIGFNGEQAMTSFLLGLLNPAAGFAYAVGVDQFGNKHPSIQASQALNLLAGNEFEQGILSSRLNLQPMIKGYEQDPANPEDVRPIYSQTEFEVKDASGHVVSIVRFGGTAQQRTMQVTDPVTGQVKSNLTVNTDSGDITVISGTGQKTVIGYVPTTEANPDGTITTTFRNSQGQITSIRQTQVFDDPDGQSSLQTTTYPNGRVEVLSINTVGQPVSRLDTIPGSGTSETINAYTYVDGRPVLQSARTVQTFDDGTRLEEVTTFANGKALTLRQVYSENNELLSSEPVAPSASSVTITDAQGIAALNDMASLIGAIQSGRPLPVLNSGLRLLNTLDNLDNNTANNMPYLGSATAMVGGLASLYSLSNALKYGDSLTQITATLSTLNYVNSTLPTLLNGPGAAALNGPLNNFLNGSGGGLINGGAPGVLPALGLVVSIRSGDPVGIATGLIGVINPALLTTSPVGWIVAGVQILSALFNEPPESWGTAKIVFDENGQLKLDSVGEGSGPQRVRIQLQGTLDVLNAMLAQAQAGNPNNPLGLVPQRMPSITWREARQDDKGYAITDIDPITGEQRYPYLRWDDTGMPFSSRPELWQPDPADPYIRASFNQHLVESALKREAIAAKWEVDTARIQQQVGDPSAGLSEAERAARMGLGATYDQAGEPVGQFRALTVDLDGDGQISTVGKDAVGNDVAFNWDDAGFQKQVAWVQPNDGFLFLDRNLNGVVDSGSELFSNSRVSDDYKGVRSLDWVDANRDGKITNVDPVFKELKIWQDLNGDGDNVTVLADGSLTLDPGELKRLTDLGITELDYVNGRLTRDEGHFALRSQQLEADAEGTLVNAVESGIVINYSQGQQQFIISKVTSLVGGADRLDNVFEDGDPFGAPRTIPQEITIPVSLLLANDTIDPAMVATLSVTEVLGAVHGSVRLGDLAGQPAIFFTPEANHNSGMGEDARFDYVVRDADGATRTVQVSIPLTAVNDLPSVSVQLDQKSIYGYGVLVEVVDYISDGEGGGQVVHAYHKDQGLPFDAPYRTVMGRRQIGTKTVGWGKDKQREPVFGDLIDTGIPLEFVQGNVGYEMVISLDNVAYQIPANPPTVLHDTPIEVKRWNDGVILATDPDGPADFTYEIVGQGVYGSATIDAKTGRFAYTGRRYVGVDENGADVRANVNTDEAARYEEVFNDVFTVRVHDGSGGFVDQAVTVPHFGPRPDPSVESGGKKPIAIDLDGDGFEFINIDDSNIFLDVNGDGWRRRTAWVGGDDGLLAFDENGNGVIDSGLELSFARFVKGAQSDLEGLRAFDTNKDGVFSAADEQWSRFGVWQDANSNGVTDAGEFKNLTDMGIAEIGMTSDGRFRVINGQTVHGVGNVTKTDGSALAMADVTLQYTNEVQTAGADGNGQLAQLLTQQHGQSFSGTTDKDLVFGTGGSDNISTGDADDAIVDDAGDDVIDAGAGNDLIFSGMGNDVVLAGDGDDSVFTGEGNDAVFGDAEGGQGNDLIMLAGGNDVAFGGAGNDFIGGGTGNDILSGDAGHDKLFGEDGWDALMGGAGDDELWGMAGNDYLEGGDGHDLMAGGAGDDVMQGGAGNDTYEVDSLGDVVDESVGGTVQGLPGVGDAGGVDAVRSSINYTLGDLLENLTLTGEAELVGAGNAKDNVLIGNAASNALAGLDGNDLLDGAAGADTLVGGRGDDTYVIDNAGDQVVEAVGEGTDTVRSRISTRLSANVENLRLIGTHAINGTGNELDNHIVGNAAANVIDGGTGNDQMSGGQGDDVYVVDSAGDVVSEAQGQGIDVVRSSVDYALTANVENLALIGDAAQGTGNALANALKANGTGSTLHGLGGDDVLTGDQGNDVLDGGEGDDLLNGLGGADQMLGGQGNDSYIVDSAGDLVIETTDQGVDQVSSSVDYTLTAHVENLQLTGAATWGTGNGLDNRMVANNLGNALAGLGGHDELIGGAGDDRLLGGEGNDMLLGNEGSDLLDGGEGADLMHGGQGDDHYRVDNTADVVVEADVAPLNEAFDAAAHAHLGGIDTVTSEVDYTLTRHVENLVLVARALVGAGNELDNTITGNDHGNTLSGLEGDDRLLAGIGSDVLQGGAGQDVLIGNAGADLLDGGTGDDQLFGGQGDDLYRVDSADDVVVEALAEGIDKVLSAVDYTLTSHVEDLELVGSATTGVGNDLNNVIRANAVASHLSGLGGDDTLLGSAGNDTLNGDAGNDELDGGVGADAMAGGSGDDSYLVDDAGDLVTEGANDGYDQVSSSISFVLPEHVEKLVLTGSAVMGTGNALSNHLVGNGLANILDGAGGVDLLEGAAGDDRYVVDNVGDVVNEQAGEGNDTVFTSVDHALSANVENLVLTGSAVTATGNDLDNALVGNAFANTLTAGVGNDVLAGGLGNDLTMGGVGNDTYLWNQGDGRDTISDTSGADSVRFGAGITLDSLSAREYTVNDQRRVFISVLDADGEERADQGIDFALDATTVTRTIHDRKGRPIGTEWETIYSSPVEFFVLTDGTVFTLDQLKPPAICTDGTRSHDTLTGSRADDHMDGWLGNDTLFGRSGNDTLIGGNGRDRLFGEGGHDQLFGGNDDDYLQGGTGNDYLDGDNGRDVLLGGAGNDKLSGGNDSDILDGGTGHDELSGGNGEDQLWAGAGDDRLSGGNDNDLLAGGAGDDLLDGGNGADFIVAGKGNDQITSGAGSDVIAFNRGDGVDVLTADTWQQDAISLGGGIRHTDLSLSRQGNDLVLGLGQGDQIVLQGWYLGCGGSGEGIRRLQIVNAADGGSYDASSTDRLVNRKVTVFDLREFVASFDRREHGGSNGAWSAEAALRSAYLSGSNSQAIGGDLAFSYAIESADEAGPAIDGTDGTDGWKAVRDQMLGLGHHMQTLCPQPITAVTTWAAMQAGISLIAEVPTGASWPIDIKPSLTQDELVTLALNTQQQLSGQPRPSWV